MSITTINHVDEAFSRLITIYKSATILRGYLEAFLNVDNEIETEFQSILTSIDVDTAVGLDLDVLGLIIGMPRPRVEFQESDIAFVISSNTDVNPGVFTFEGGWSVGTWFPTEVIEGGATTIATLGDPRYRQMLIAKIKINYFDGGADSALLSIQALCSGAPNVTIVESVALRPVITVAKRFTPFELLLFKDAYVGNQIVPTGPSITTPTGSPLYTRNLGVFYDITDLDDTIEYSVSDPAGNPASPEGLNADGIPFDAVGGLSSTTVSDGVLWSGAE